MNVLFWHLSSQQLLILESWREIKKKSLARCHHLPRICVFWKKIKINKQLIKWHKSGGGHCFMNDNYTLGDEFHENSISFTHFFHTPHLHANEQWWPMTLWIFKAVTETFPIWEYFNCKRKTTSSSFLSFQHSENLEDKLMQMFL